MIHPSAFWDERGVDLLLGRSVDKVDPVSHVVTTSDDEDIGYGKMIRSTGGSPCRLLCAGTHLLSVDVVRNKQDVDSILGDLDDAADVTIIGGGCIG
jgi:3-phenylpropionate/trans-cinnamate dioxygenase ferredoxin reductase subunit